MSKKGLYHSELVKMSPVTAKILSEPQDSKFPDKPRWIALEINGEERFLNCENVSIELALAGLAGQWARLTALGRGEDALIQIEDAVTAAEKPSPVRRELPVAAPVRNPALLTLPRRGPQQREESAGTEDGVLAARRHIMQAANLYNLCVACVDKAVAPTMPEIARTSEMFQAATGTLFIEASRAGFVAKMPEKPL